MKDTIDFADNMGKLSQKTGVAVEELSALNYAAQLSDVSTDSLATAFKKLAVNQSDAIKGTGEAKDAFAAIGISVADLKAKSPDQLLKTIADRFAGYEDGANKAALAVKIFGRAGTELIPLLNQGSAGIGQMEAQARSLGVVLDSQTAAAANQFNDNMKTLSASFDGFKIAVANNVLPGLIAITGAFTEAVTKGEGFKGLMESFNAIGAGGPFADPKQVKSLDVLRGQLDTLLKQRQQLKARLADEGFFGFLTEKGDKEQLDNVEFQIYRINNRMLELQKTLEGQGGGAPPPPKKPAPQINDTGPTEEQKRLERLIERQKELNQQFNDGTRSADQYHDAIRNLYDLPTHIQGVDALKPIDLSSQIGAQLSALADSLKSQEEIEVEAYEARKMLAEQNITDEDGRYKVLEDLAQQHQANMLRIESSGIVDLERFNAASQNDRLAASAKFLKGMTAQVATQNKAMFNIWKVSAIAEGVLDMQQAIMGAYKFGARIGGPVLGGAFAAVAGAAQLASLNAIKNASFGGAGGGTTPGGAVPVSQVNPLTGQPTAVAAAPTSQKTVQVYFSGNMYGWDDYVRKQVISGIKEAVDGADVILFSGTSRQAKEIRG
jgi:hypothetical protein